MRDDGSASTAMLGLDGFVLLGVSTAFGELERVIETTAARAWCTGCGAAATAHGRRQVRVRDLPSGGRAVTLVWLKRLWRCAEQQCPVSTWSEVSEQLRPRASLSERARACQMVCVRGVPRLWDRLVLGGSNDVCDG